MCDLLIPAFDLANPRLEVLDAALGEILVTCSKLDLLIQHGERYLRPESRRSNMLSFYKSAEVHYEPLGTVAAIVSWNYRKHVF